MSNTVATPKLGQAVKYISTRGQAKMGLVIGTPETIQEGTSVPALSEGQVHLAVFSPTGGIAPRYNVPSAEFLVVNGQAGDFQNAEGNLVGVYELD